MSNVVNELSYSDAFNVEDSFSEEMLKSIPKKIFSWLDNAGQLEMEGSTAELVGQVVSWEFQGDEIGGSLSWENVDTGEAFKMWWEGNPLEATQILVSDHKFTNISKNLEVFTHLEEQIYTTIEHFVNESLI